MGSTEGGLLLGDKTRARQRGVVGRGSELREKAKALSHLPSMCFMFALRHEVIEQVIA